MRRRMTRCMATPSYSSAGLAHDKAATVSTQYEGDQMKTRQTSVAQSALAVLALALSLGLCATSVLAETKRDKKAVVASSAKKAPSKKAKFLPGSQESAGERATRLKRECKGAVNAGACQGHTG